MIKFKEISYNQIYGCLKFNLREIMFKKNISIKQLNKMCDVKYDVLAKCYYNRMQFLSCNIISKLVIL